MNASTDDVPGPIFISYRREDTAYPAAWLFDRLTSRFGRSQVKVTSAQMAALPISRHAFHGDWK